MMMKRVVWISLAWVLLWLIQPTRSGKESALLPATNDSSSNTSHPIWIDSTTSNSLKNEDSIKVYNETTTFVNSSILQPSPIPSLSPLPSAVTTGPYLTPPDVFGNRILIMALSFDVTHSDAMNELLSEYLSMCEGGWNVTGTELKDFHTIHHFTVYHAYSTVLLYTGEEWAPDLLTFYKRRTYCYRINDSITFKFSVRPKSIGISLAAEHRKELPKYAHDYDIFLYHEDDIVFRYKHLVAFVEETKRLQNMLPDGERNDYGIGFLRMFTALHSSPLLYCHSICFIPNFLCHRVPKNLTEGC